MNNILLLCRDETFSSCQCVFVSRSFLFHTKYINLNFVNKHPYAKHIMTHNHNSTGYGPRSRLYFNGEMNTYNIWETRFTNYLYTLDATLLKAILPKVSETADDGDFADKNRRAYAELTQVLDERSLEMIMTDCKDNGREALKTLRQHYASTEKPRVLTLYEELTTLNMTDSETITDYLLRAERASTGLKTAGETIFGNLIIAMVLKGLPESFQPFVVVHTQLDKYKTMAEFKAALHNFANTEAMRNNTQSTATALSMRNDYQPHRQQNHMPNYKSQTTRSSQPHSKMCLACGKSTHNTRECYSKSKLNCSYCKQQGHIEKVCFKKKRDAVKPSTATEHKTATVDIMPEYTFTSNITDNTITTNLSTQEKLLVINTRQTTCRLWCHMPHCK